MLLNLNFIIQDNQFHFIPKIHLHLPAYEEDFFVFSATWLCFNFMMTPEDFLSDVVTWRDVVKIAVREDEEKMEKLDILVTNCDEYTHEEFSHKAKYIINGIL